MNMTQLKKCAENLFFAFATTLLTAVTWFWDTWGPLRYVFFILSFYLLAWHIFRYSQRIAESHAVDAWFQSQRALLARGLLCVAPASAGLLVNVFRQSTFGAIVGLVASVVLLIWKVPQWQADGAAQRQSLAISERIGLEIQARKALGLVIGMVLGGLAILYLALVLDETIKSKHMTGLYASAVEQLNSPNEGVRVGGAYALRDVGLKSPDFGPVVLDIFSGFLRSRSVWRKGKEEPPGTDALLIARLTAEISRKTRETRALDLSRVDLRGADLSGAELAEVRLTASCLDRAILNYAALERAQLNYASLNQGSFYKAHLESANLWQAEGEKPSFRSAFLNGASLRKARFARGTFTEAILDHADLAEGSFRGSTFVKASLKGIRAQKVDFQGSDFSGADLTGADFTGADLTGCTFEGARTNGLILKDAVLVNTHGLSAHFQSDG